MSLRELKFEEETGYEGSCLMLSDLNYNAAPEEASDDPEAAALVVFIQDNDAGTETHGEVMLNDMLAAHLADLDVEGLALAWAKYLRKWADKFEAAA